MKEKMGGRSFVITCGAFKDTLMYNIQSVQSSTFRGMCKGIQKVPKGPRYSKGT